MMSRCTRDIYSMRSSLRLVNMLCRLDGTVQAYTLTKHVSRQIDRDELYIPIDTVQTRPDPRTSY